MKTLLSRSKRRLTVSFFVSSVPHDELREIFNDISSSSEDEEDEGDRHDDEDLNIMDTEDDLVQQLQDKLDESDSAQNENDRNNQIGEKTVKFVSDLFQREFSLFLILKKLVWAYTL